MFFPARGAAPLGTLVHFHGNAENMTSHFGFSAWLQDAGFNVFIFDYRGYGASSGEKDLSGAVLDGVAALEYVRSRPDVDKTCLLVLGQSLGAAIAVAAVKISSEGVRGLALDSPFRSFRSVARDRLERLVLTWPLAWPLSRVLISDRYSPEREIRSLKGIPLLILHGDKDRVVPYPEGAALFKTAPEPKTLWAIEGGVHTDALGARKDVYRPKIVEFFRSCLP